MLQRRLLQAVARLGCCPGTLAQLPGPATQRAEPRKLRWPPTTASLWGSDQFCVPHVLTLLLARGPQADAQVPRPPRPGTLTAGGLFPEALGADPSAPTPGLVLGLGLAARTPRLNVR